MDTEQMETLRGVLAVAIADGRISPAEKGVIRGLARKAGVSQAWLNEMIEKAEQGATVESSTFRPLLKDPEKAMTLLVGTAAIDGQVSDEERTVLVDISLKVGLAPGKFGEVLEKGMAIARRLRQQRSDR
jgi:tellurite resistance protein